MARELKFRAWDGETMHYNYIVGRPQSANVLAIMNDESFAKEQYGLNEWKVMQFTGTLDKNKNPIYEGDIIVDATYPGPNRYPVKFVRGAFRWISVTLDELWWIENAEVIGNIYENPELIKCD